jgi:hypothetical protein
MNKYCLKDCKHKTYCRLDEEKTRLCKVDSKEDGKIFGRTFAQINAMQHKGKA